MFKISSNVSLSQAFFLSTGGKLYDILTKPGQVWGPPFMTEPWGQPGNHGGASASKESSKNTSNRKKCQANKKSSTVL